MKYGLLSGVLWALNSVVLGVALSMSPFISTEQAIFLAPFVSTFLNDMFSMMLMSIINLFKRNIKTTFRVMFSKKGLWIILASILGGPLGMTGYVLSIRYMSSSIAAISSAVYPAIGCVLAKIFLKENMTCQQWLFLILCILGIYGMSYSSDITVNNFLLGLLGTVMCTIGWGLEAVVIGKGLRNEQISTETALQIKYITSACTYAAILLPALQAWHFTITLFDVSTTQWLIPAVLLAAVFGTTSYLSYYKAIDLIGASKAMAFNMTYVAWAMIFSLVIYRNFESYTWLSYVCVLVVLICGILAGTDITNFKSRNKENE